MVTVGAAVVVVVTGAAVVVVVVVVAGAAVVVVVVGATVVVVVVGAEVTGLQSKLTNSVVFMFEAPYGPPHCASSESKTACWLVDDA